jgi:hypothetical protein
MDAKMIGNFLHLVTSRFKAVGHSFAPLRVFLRRETARRLGERATLDSRNFAQPLGSLRCVALAFGKLLTSFLWGVYTRWEIADYSHVDRSTVSRAVRAIEAQGALRATSAERPPLGDA